MKLADPYPSIAILAAKLQRDGDENFWQEFEMATAAVFGQKLFTVLAFDVERRRLMRVHSSRPEINPIGGAKAVTDSYWTRHVLTESRFYVGSTKEDIKTVFPDYELLWANGCESVLNIPVRKNRVTVGTLNLLDGPGNYDDFSEIAALLLAQLAVDRLVAYLANPPASDTNVSQLERV